jgi:hypothetical protein
MSLGQLVSSHVSSSGIRPCSAKLSLQLQCAHPQPPHWLLLVLFCLFVCLPLVDSKKKKMRQQTSRRVWDRQLHSLAMLHSFIRVYLPFYNSVWFISPKSVFSLWDFKLECICRAQKAQNNDPAFWCLKTRKAFCFLLTLYSLKVTFPVLLKNRKGSQGMWLREVRECGMNSFVGKVSFHKCYALNRWSLMSFSGTELQNMSAKLGE